MWSYPKWRRAGPRQAFSRCADRGWRPCAPERGLQGRGVQGGRLRPCTWPQGIQNEASAPKRWPYLWKWYACNPKSYACNRKGYGCNRERCACNPEWYGCNPKWQGHHSEGYGHHLKGGHPLCRHSSPHRQPPRPLQRPGCRGSGGWRAHQRSAWGCGSGRWRRRWLRA